MFFSKCVLRVKKWRVRWECFSIVCWKINQRDEKKRFKVFQTTTQLFYWLLYNASPLMLYYAGKYGCSFWVCGWNPAVLSSVLRLLSHCHDFLILHNSSPTFRSLLKASLWKRLRNCTANFTNIFSVSRDLRGAEGYVAPKAWRWGIRRLGCSHISWCKQETHVHSIEKS